MMLEMDRSLPGMVRADKMHHVVRLERNLLVVAHGHAGHAAHGLTLAAGGDDDDFFGIMPFRLSG